MQTDFSREFFYPCINHDINRVINHMTNHTHPTKWVMSFLLYHYSHRTCR
ncbi:hypothetical protein [Moraxella lacunata]